MAGVDPSVYLDVHVGGYLQRAPSPLSLLTTHVYTGGHLTLWKVKKSKINMWFITYALEQINSFHLNSSYFFEDVHPAGYRFLRRLQTNNDAAVLARLGYTVVGIRVYVVNNVPEMRQVAPLFSP